MKVLLWIALSLLGQTQDRGRNEDPVRVEVHGGALATLTAEVGTALTPMATVSVDGPIFLGSSAHARGAVSLAISSSPGETVTLTQIETFRAVEATGFLYHVFGSGASGEHQLRTSVEFSGGFSSRLPGEQTPADRVSMFAYISLKFEDRTTGNYLAIGYGRDQRLGPREWGQAGVRGRVKLPRTPVSIEGRASINVGPDRDVRLFSQRAVVQLGVTLDIVDSLTR